MPWNHTTLSFSSYLCCLSNTCSSSLAQNECLHLNEFVHRTFKNIFRFPPTFLFTRSYMDRVYTEFHCQILWACLFLAQNLWDGDPSMGLGPLTLQEGLPIVMCVPPCAPPIPVGWRSVLFCIFASPASLDVVFLYVFSYRGSVHLFFRWFPKWLFYTKV